MSFFVCFNLYLLILNIGDAMFYKYEIKTENNKEVLYLYVDDNYEFSKEFMNNSGSNDLYSKIKKYISDMKIKFNGVKICLVVSGIVITLLLSSNGTISNKPVLINNNVEEVSEVIKVDEPGFFDDVEESISVEPDVKNPPIAETNPSSKKETINTQSKVEKVVTQKPVVEEKKENIVESEKEEVIENKKMVTVYRSSGIVEEIELEEYIVGVVGGEMPASFNVEALKAQAVVARTYTLKRLSEGKVLTDNVSTQIYRDTSQLHSMWGSGFNKYYSKVKNAVDVTKGQYITYNNQYIDAVYHSTSNGYTEDAQYVWGYSIPYLKSVDSHWDLSATPYLRKVEKTNDNLLKLLGIQIDEETSVEVLEKSSSNRINKIQIGENIYNGTDLYKKLSLRSRDFDFEVSSDGVVITTRGYGHGVGMSQYGANGMANDGYNYKQIIHHYYNNVEISG